MSLLTKNSRQVLAFKESLNEMILAIEKMKKGRKPLLNGECYLTDKEVSERLKVSRRTLQDYRDQGIIPYIKLGGKILYRSSDLEKLLCDNYYKSL